MKLRKIANIQSGYISRKKIESNTHGSHFLLQARNVDGDNLSYSTEALIRFAPDLSKKDRVLRRNDVLFMARGTKNFSVLIEDLPDSVLAAGSFFIIRVRSEDILPEYLWWYLNQAPVENYLMRHTGRGVHMPVVTRAILENLEVPVPSMKIQKNIIETNKLMRREQELLDLLAKKKRQLATGVCLEALKDVSGKER
jgi:restriction endonuclease S subunit